MLNCSLLRLKFRERHSPKCDVNFHKSLCHYSENHLIKIFPFSPVKLLEDPKQIATQILFAFLTILDLYCKHTKSISKSENMKLDFFAVLVLKEISPHTTYV